MSLQEKAQAVAQEFQKLQADMAKAVEAREKLGTQQSENELVKKVRLSSGASCTLYEWPSVPGIRQTHAIECGV